MNKGKLPFHYGWVIVGAGTLSIFAGLGFGRFALGMLLPSMSGPLGLSYSQMGFISTGNFIGYLLSVLVSGFLSARFGPRRIIFAALILTGATMTLVGTANGFFFVLTMYSLTGVGSGAANVPTMGLVPAWFARKSRGKAAGFIVIGSGFAIIVSGHLIPFVNGFGGAVGWRINWAVIGSLVFVVGFVCYALIRNRPEDKGLKPYGIEDSPARLFVEQNLYRMRIIYHLGAIYFLFGFTYAIYITFVVTSMVGEWGLTEFAAGGLWAWVGILSLISGPLFGTLSDRFGRKTGFAVVFVLHATAYLCAAFRVHELFLYVSIFAFGIAAWSIPSIMAASVGDYVGSSRSAQAFGIVTFIFAIGQIAGPAVAGMLADAAGGFALSFVMAAALAVLAAALSLLLKKPQTG